MFTKTDIEKYFNAEKSESLVFIIIGVAAIALALVFFFYLKTNWYKGFAIPLLLIGLLQLIVGFTVYKRCDEDRIRNVYAYGMDVAELKTKEIPRMDTVNKNLVVYRYVEVVLLLAGLAIFFYFRLAAGKAFWAGFGLALAIEAAVMLSADFIAEKRAHQYSQGIQSYLDQLK